MRALVVEPEATLCQSLALYLSRCRAYQVASTHTGTDARKLLSQERFDLILCAETLPDGDGLCLLKEWLGAPRPPLVVLMTASRDEALAHRGKRLGVRGCLAKPFDVQELEALLGG
jgi:DNA-binding response OmpR family regulator